MMPSYYWGQIAEVYPPNDPNNAGKTQYEYQVMITGDLYTTIPTRCIRKDEYGNRDSFDDLVLAVSDKVMVMFPRGERSLGLILHGTRNYVAPMNPALGRYWMNRFNKIVRGIDQNFNYSVTSDSGPNLQVGPQKIVLDDASGESITVDKAGKSITISSNTFTVNVQGDADVSIQGDANVTAQNVNITAMQNAVVKADMIQLNGQAGQILTTVTDPVVDSIFGIPTTGVPTVVSGG